MDNSAAKKTKKPTKDEIPLIRELPTSARYFWKGTYAEYVRQEISDKTADGTNPRKLPPNEILALALNEVAAKAGSGFFFHAPNRDSWSRQAFEPKSRGPPPLGASFPSLVYMNYAWSEQARIKFLQSSHRTRYLACDFQLNPPSSYTPVYCFQVAGHYRYALYRTLHNSYIILQSKAGLYFFKLAEYETIAGRWSGRKTRTVDPLLRLNTLSSVWDEDNTNANRVALERFRCTSLEDMYNNIFRTCQPSVKISTLTSGEIWQLTPRPLQPRMEVILGTKLGGEGNKAYNLAGPPSRHGARLNREAPPEDEHKRKKVRVIESEKGIKRKQAPTDNKGK